jgi:nitric oxide reductase subunit B
LVAVSTGCRAHALDQTETVHTAEFLIYSALTTVARRPDASWSWTENWPYEPEVGNTPTTNTFIWTWASFCFTFLAFGGVLFIYERYLSDPDRAAMDPVLATFRPLTDSQRRIGQYFVAVAAVLLVQILAGSIVAHAYYDRRSFYGIDLASILPFNFLRDVLVLAWQPGPFLLMAWDFLVKSRPILPRLVGRMVAGQRAMPTAAK